MSTRVVTQENSRQSHASRRHTSNSNSVAVDLKAHRDILELVLALGGRGLGETSERVIVTGLEVGVLVKVVAVDGDQGAAGVVLDFVVDVGAGIDSTLDQTAADSGEATDGSGADLEERGEEGDDEGSEDGLHFDGWIVYWGRDRKIERWIEIEIESDDCLVGWLVG